MSETSDDRPDNQLVPVQADVNENDDLFDGSESDSQVDDPDASTSPIDRQVTADAAHGILDVEGCHEMTVWSEGQEEDIRESIEADLQPNTQSRIDTPMLDHHKSEFSPQQQSQEAQREPQQHAYEAQDQPNEHDPAMENEPDSTVPTAVINAQPPSSTSHASSSVQNDNNLEDSTSLFIPEHFSSAHSPATLPSRLSAAPSRVASPSDRQSATSAKPSMFARFRHMQKLAQGRKKNLNRQAASSLFGIDLDPEAYLEAVTAGIRAPAGAFPVQVDEYEMAHRKALADFQEQKEHYERIRKQYNGRLPFRQDIEWMKIKGVEDSRLRKRQRELGTIQEGDEQDLFPPVVFQADEQDEDYEDEFYDNGPSRKRRPGAQPRKQGKQLSMQDAELQAMRVALEASEDVPKKKQKRVQSENEVPESRSSTKSRASKSKTARPSRAKGAAKSAAKTPRKTVKDKHELERATKQATSLFNANVFEQQAGMGAADQPIFVAKSKAEALKELIASVPIEDKKLVRSDMNVLLQASKDFDGMGACKISTGGNWLIRGMKTSLKGYQVLGSAFMRRRENDTQEPRGGLMADQMGLGKTLMMLANIVNSRDDEIKRKVRDRKATLLVASPALLTQWAAEIEQHTDCNMKVIRYGAGSRVDSTNTVHILQTQDIILTTYSEVMKSYPKNEPPIECQTAGEKIEWWKETYANNRGVLHQMMFKRVILDEAQAIKNHQGRTSIACRALMAHHKWALSGTPILNGLDELYPYFKFLNVPHTGSFKVFKQNYCSTSNGENAERLLVRLSQFMIRRTHADRMFNAPILKLPQANQSTYWCDFNSVERSIYNIVHQRFAKNINMWSKKGTLEKSYSNVLVMLLRLRQLTAHVLMLQFVMRDLLEREDIECIKKIVREQATVSNMRQGRTILAIRKQLDAHELREKRKAAAKAARRLAAEEAAKASKTEYVEPDDDEADEEDDAPVEVPYDGEVDEEEVGARRGAERNKSGKGFGKSYDFKPFVNSLTSGNDWEKKKEKAICGECGRHPTKPWMTACGHLICGTCYEDCLNAAAEVGNTMATCKACGQTFGGSVPCEEEVEEFPGAARATRNRTALVKKKEKERFDREDIADDWLSLGGDDVLPSAKTIAIKAQILNWTRENPSVKIIIYTQFLAMIRILAKICQHEGWGTEQYHGKMSLTARDKAIKEFASNPKSRILLASLRCGGLGLNLTMASKVIIIDPWWNQASEQQAFCRVFRIGQQDETFMSRMCVKNTVDERLIQMQKEKQKEIDAVMEDRGKKTKNLGIADLMRLFGNIGEADDGRPFIMVENPPVEGGFHADGDHEGYADEL